MPVKYVVVIQNQYGVVKNCIECDSMKRVQEVLEELEPFMDAEYLISGEAESITFPADGCTYSFRKLENADQYVGDFV